MADVYVLADDYTEFCRNFNYRPDRKKFPYPKIGTVLDEDKSVKWNREEVDRLRAAHDEEVKRLQRHYNEVAREYEKEIKQSLAEEYDLNEAEVDVIWGKAWEDGHDCGIRNVISHFYDLASFYEDLKKAHKKRSVK